MPKVESSEELSQVDRMLQELELERGMPPGRISVLPLVETALGVVRSKQLALTVSDRVLTLVFGSGDFSTDLGVDLTRDTTSCSMRVRASLLPRVLPALLLRSTAPIRIYKTRMA